MKLTYENLERAALSAGDSRIRKDVQYEASKLLAENKITKEQYDSIIKILEWQ